MKTGFIGAGRVGCSLGKYLKESAKSWQVAGYCSRSGESAGRAAAFTDSRVYKCAGDLAADCEVIFITTPDGEIAAVWKELCGCGVSLAGKIIVHCSGALSSAVFAGAESSGATRASLHPFYAVSDCFHSYETLGGALFTLEGSGGRLEEFYQKLQAGGLTVQRLRAEHKAAYHAAASVASNLMVGLTELAIGLLTDCGFDREHARMALRPLMQGNLDAVMEKDTAAALTGPAERADAATVERHLQALAGGDREIYRLLTKKIVGIAKQKHPERDYARVEDALR